MTNSVLESSIETRFVNQLAAVGLKALKLKAESVRGWPDRTVLLPGAKVVYVEFKRAKDEDLRERQKWVRRWLVRMGFEYHVIKSRKDAERLAKAIVQRL